MKVQFTDNSTGNPTLWHWNFGNGQTSSLQNPVVFFDPGTWTVTLTTENGSGTSAPVTQVITVNEKPTVAFTASSTTGCFPLPIQFTDQSSANVVKYEWDFGDGDVSSDRNPYHVYRRSGSFVASLKATNAAGCSDFSKPVTITINSGVKADYTNTVSQSCKPPALVTFTNTSQEFGTMSYLWDFGDGSTDTRKNPPAHTYAEVKAYTVTLVAKSDQGCVDTLIGNNQINIVNSVNSDFTYVNGSCSGVATTLTNTSAPQPFTAIWDFGDGTPTSSGTVNVSHVFANSGTYYVKLVNNFGNCLDSTTKPVAIVTGSNAGFFSPDTLSCKTPANVTFTDTTKGSPTTWSWNFGDGSTSTLQNPAHTYARTGLFNVTLAVKNGNGCTSTKTLQQYVKIAIPTATIDIPVANGCNTLDINAKATVNSVDGVASYTWKFGDGTADFTSTSSPLVTHHYGSIGTYTLTLIATTKGGCSVTATQSIEIGVLPTLVDFSVSNTNPCAGTAINFTDLSQPTSGINRWLWNFGDGSTSAVQNPSYRYTGDNNGVPYDVKLTVYNNGCAASITKPALVKVNPPVAKFTYQINCNNKKEFTFVDKSTSGSTVLWDFGDGTPISSQSGQFTHAYPAFNTKYKVTIKATLGACVNVSDTVPVFTLAVDSNFIILGGNTRCANTQTVFVPVNTTQGATSYIWDFGDGTPPLAAYAPDHFYKVTGTFTTKLTIKDTNNCSSTSVPQQVVVKGVKAAFSISPLQGCIGVPITLTNTSTASSTSTTWNWTFGDGTSSTQKDPPSPYSYSKQGAFPVKLIVADGGCADSATTVVNITQPYAAFSVDTASCPGAPMQFLNTSTGNTLTYLWNFGDGQTSTQANPIHAYPPSLVVPSSATVKLTARDINGCSKDTSRIITFDKPTISFTPTTGTTNCPPLAMDFISTSHYVATYDWDFGDGAHSSAANPSHTYYYPNDNPGYVIKLTATSPGGCTAVYTSSPITIYGPQGDFSFDPKGACNNTNINFAVANAKGVKTYTWDFKDGNSNTTAIPASSHVYNTVGNYLPRVILEDATGCQVPITAVDTLKIIGINPQFTFKPATLCDTGTVVFTDASTSNGTITGYSWNFGDGATGVGSSVPHFYAKTGSPLTTYSVTLNVSTSAPVCTQSVTYKDSIIIYASPSVSVQGPKEGCEPATLTYKGVLNNGPNYAPITWQWNFGNGQTATGQTPSAQTFATAGNYAVALQATNEKGCVGKDTLQLTIHPLPKTNAGIDSLICLGQNIQLQASGADSYEWVGPSTTTLSCTVCPTPIATPTQTTSYFLAGATTFGCVKLDTVKVSVNQPVHIMVDPMKDSLCVGQSTQLRAVGASLYNWSPAAGLSSTTISNPVANPTVSTVYKVVASDSKSCFFDSATVDITVFKYPTLELGPDASIPSGTSYQINGQGSSDIVSITWKPGTGLSCDNCLNPVASPVKTTNYYATATNNGNCSVADNITIVVFCNEQNFFMPNTFSPNNDGMNDVFYPRGKGLTRINTFRIYNRLGQLIFEKQNFGANDTSAGWNGMINGEKAPQDVYTYIIEFVCNNSQIVPYKGNVSLIR
ncbi:PKD domain-containing protein [Parasegetibacter sp. MAH-26]|uniref:PKD domain-containing protein n=1 Tax=Pinibacter aurantiacus TaxID=2851599 RepID=A0A9E2S8U3_9BACT|nr:PKD domain-containing protein [Pinibacter aurantiacus]